MENMLIDLLEAFANMMGISGEGMAAIVCTLLPVMAFLGLVVIGKLLFAGLALMGHDFSKVDIGKSSVPYDDSSMAYSDAFNLSNINHNKSSVSYAGHSIVNSIE